MIIDEEVKSIKPNEKIELKPKPNCKWCFGKGYIRVIPQHLNANKYRELRPCQCVKAIIELKQATPEKQAE